MHVTIRRYESIDQSRKAEVLKKVDETLLPVLSELPGFSGYSLIDAGNGVMTSVGFFDTAAQAEESTRVAGSWLREQKLETTLRARRRSRAATSSSTRRASSSRPKPFEPDSVRRRPAHAGLLRRSTGRSRRAGDDAAEPLDPPDVAGEPQVLGWRWPGASS